MQLNYVDFTDLEPFNSNFFLIVCDGNFWSMQFSCSTSKIDKYQLILKSRIAAKELKEV